MRGLLFLHFLLCSSCFNAKTFAVDETGQTINNGMAQNDKEGACGVCYCTPSPDQDIKALVIEAEHRLLGIITQMSTRMNMLESRLLENRMESQNEQHLEKLQFLDDMVQENYKGIEDNSHKLQVVADKLSGSIGTAAAQALGYSCMVTDDSKGAHRNPVCFKYHDDLKNWDDAKQECGKYGGRLAGIHSKEEDDFVNSLITVERSPATPEQNVAMYGPGGTHEIVWFGLRQVSATTYRWITGENFTVSEHDGTSLNGEYTNWQNPEQWDRGVEWNDEVCICKWRLKGLLWADYLCWKSYPYVCEFIMENIF